MKTTYIYILTDPRDNQPKYVGKSVKPRKRLSQHLSRFPHTLCGNWLKSLTRLGLKPIMEIIDECEGNWEWLECYWIAQFKNWGFTLKNGTIGGMGLDSEYVSLLHKGKTVSKETRAKIANTLRGTSLTQERKNKISTNTSIALRERNAKSLNRELLCLSKNGQTYINSYDSISQAVTDTGILHGSISNAVGGRARTAGGYVWKWSNLN